MSKKNPRPQGNGKPAAKKPSAGGPPLSSPAMAAPMVQVVERPAPVYGLIDRWLVDNFGFDERRLWQLRILISTYIGYVGYYMTRKVFGIAKTSIVEELHIKLSDTGQIWTAFLTAYMVGQFLNGFIGRRYGPRILMVGGLALSMACNVVFGFADSYHTLLIFMAFNGLVQASGWPGAVGTVAQWLSPAERGRVMGAWGTNFIFGNMLVKSVGGFLLGCSATFAYDTRVFSFAGWRLAFLGCTIITFGIWWLIYAWQRDKPEHVGLPQFAAPKSEEMQTVEGSREDRITVADYLRLVFHPVVLTMGTSYFCIKFLRYALDSWLPAFLNLKGMETDVAAYASGIFDVAGFAGAIIAGWALDRWFRGRWAFVCFMMSLGLILAYLAVMFLGTTPWALAICFGLVGFMLFGPDVMLSGAASVQVAGEKNGGAVTGIVNGLGSIGPIFQEQIIGWLMKSKGDVATAEETAAGIRNTNILTLSMSIAFALLMLAVMWRIRIARRHIDGPDSAK